MLKGIGVSPGVAYANVLLWNKPTHETIRRKGKSAALELAKFAKALQIVTQKNNEARERTARRFGDSEAAIFDAYHMMLNDEEGLVNPILENIEFRHYTAEFSIKTQFDTLARQFLSMDSEYMRQRAEDIYSLRDQLLQTLRGTPMQSATHLNQPTIIVAHSLGPADLASIDLSRFEGFVCETGGYTSHTAIIARTLGLPGVIAPGILQEAQNDDTIAIDGNTGEILCNPGKKQIAIIRRNSRAYAQNCRLASLYRGQPTITTDGHRIELSTSIGQLEELDAAIECDAENIGIFRTEMLHVARLPMATEEQQFAIYRTLLEKMSGKAVTVRTFDDGGNQPALPIKGHPLETNPAMGFRGARMSLGRLGFFRTQLRALLRASAYGTLRILLPMVTTVEELDSLLACIEEAKLELGRLGEAFDENIATGILIDVPAAALSAAQLAPKVDFFTLDLNDLTQFTLAAGRNNATVAYLFHQNHPALLRLAEMSITAAHNAGIPCYVSGDMQELEKQLPLFTGMGTDGFCLSPSFVLSARRILNSTARHDCYRLAQDILAAPTATEVAKRLSEYAAAHKLRPAQPNPQSSQAENEQTG